VGQKLRSQGHAVFRARPEHKAPKRHGIAPGLFYGMFAVLAGTNVAALVALLMAPDIAALVGGQTDTTISAYEDRIAQLRVEVDRLHSRQYAQAGDINLQLQELSQQQELLLEQHQLVKQLASKASELGLEPVEPSGDIAATPAAIAPGTGRGDLAELGTSMTNMMVESREAIAALAQSADQGTSAILSALGDIGIRPKLPEALNDAVGGPYAPERAGEPESIVDDANAVFLSLARFEAARGAIDVAPVHLPLSGVDRVSSTFGNRRDPFSGGRAFHAGIDYPKPSGTLVLSAGYGKVTFTGERSGYGKLVEITHGNGLVTRYGHLSAFLVKKGQVVETGMPIAKVGSTGRSTGPHLHFEVRRDDVAVDPARYLAIGKRLARFLAG
jgi:murein DD-endopeptidase MepM/ murein hydrolase activator NlpD